MAFNVGDIVRRKTHIQKFKVKTVLQNSEYECNYEPNTAPDVVLVFKETDLELVS